MRIYFITTNPHKFSEADAYVKAYAAKARADVELCQVKRGLDELMVPDIRKVVHAKAVEAYREFGLPCAVEHSGLFVKSLHRLPGVLGKLIWDSMGERMCSLVSEDEGRDAVARSVVGYCDGRRVRLYSGATPGSVAARPLGDYKFCWDPVFIPRGGDRTYGELGPEAKLATSPSAKAWRKFLNDLLLARRSA